MKHHLVNDDLASYLIRLQEEERKRVAIELHEGISQTIYSIYTGLQLLENQQQEGEMKKLSADLLFSARGILDELRALSAELYPHTLDRLGIYQTVRSYLDTYAKTFGILVHSKSVGIAWELTEIQNIILFRACQEVILNAAKHADTSQINVEFHWGTHDLTIMIEDMGIGFDIGKLDDDHHTGLDAITYQFSLIKGVVSVESTPDIGTKVILKVPYRYESQGKERCNDTDTFS